MKFFVTLVPCCQSTKSVSHCCTTKISIHFLPFSKYFLKKIKAQLYSLPFMGGLLCDGQGLPFSQNDLPAELRRAQTHGNVLTWFSTHARPNNLYGTSKKPQNLTRCPICGIFLKKTGSNKIYMWFFGGRFWGGGSSMTIDNVWRSHIFPCCSP